MRNRVLRPVLQLNCVLLLLVIIIALSESMPFEDAVEEIDNDEMENEDASIEEEESDDGLLFQGDIGAIIPTGTDCLDLHEKYSNLKSGVYTLAPPGIGNFSAYCDMDTDGGGWTVFQRRMNNDISFYDKTWVEYKNGFNNGLTKNLWLGNDKIHVLSTKDANVELRIDIWGDRAPGASNPNVYLYGKWTSFSIDNEANYYTFHISSISTGNASTGNGYSINYNNGKKFSTIDVSHDNWSKGNHNCSGVLKFGGWWLNSCTFVSLNGKYDSSIPGYNYGFIWYTGKDQRLCCANPAESRMMLRKLGT